MKRLILTLLVGTAFTGVHAQQPVQPVYGDQAPSSTGPKTFLQPVEVNHGLPTAGVYPGMVAGTPITRPSDTTTYTANTTVCSAKSVTACVAGTIPISNSNGGRLLGNRVTLWKSGAATTNASFIVWFFSAPPFLA